MSFLDTLTLNADGKILCLHCNKSEVDGSGIVRDGIEATRTDAQVGAPKCK